MSLLMDALRRAESSGEKPQESTPLTATENPADADKPSLQLEPAAESPATQEESSASLTHSEIDRMLELESGEHGTLPTVETSSARSAQDATGPELAPLAEPDDEDNKADNRSATSSPQPAGNRDIFTSTTWFLSGLVSVVAIVGGYYLWHTRLSSQNTLITAGTDLPMPGYTVQQEAPATRDQEKPVVSPIPGIKPVTEVAPPVATVARKNLPPANHGEAEPTVSKKSSTPQSIKIHKTSRADSIQTVLQQAYIDYKGKQYSQADKLYRKVLKRYPHNRDALLGVAAISVMRGDYVTARRNYERILKSNPSDTNARLGLQSILGSEDPLEQISQLKFLIDKHPRDAQLRFSLANQYVQLGQWTEAQQSYFEAVRLAPEQADYTYNLAISLDQLGLATEALEFYLKAQQLTANNASLLDRQQLKTRIRQLQAAPARDNP